MDGVNSKLSILIVDDNKDLRVVLKRVIEGNFVNVNLSISEAESGQQAANEISRIKFDLIISDFQMPNGDGLWLSNFISGLSIDLPLIIFSAFGDVASSFSATGHVRFVSKEDIQDLIDLIRSSLRL